MQVQHLVAYGTETGQGILQWEGEAIRRSLLPRTIWGSHVHVVWYELWMKIGDGQCLPIEALLMDPEAFVTVIPPSIDVIHLNIAFLGNH
jgi:hypothetical protein